ncbi:MAG: CPBP family intramembrane metalloprotease [Methanobrevibacter sp.]|nr:CPBP family intramembrane metalloprotease [Methanobrevibacter sp.]
MKSFNNAYADISIIQIILVFIIGIFLGAGIDVFFNIHIGIPFMEICLVLFIVFKIRKSKDSIQLQLKDLSNNFPIKTIIIIFILNVLFSIGIGILFDYLTPFVPVGLSGNSSVLDNTNLLVLIGSLFFAIIIAPIFEELVFRGFIFSKIASYSTISIGIIVSSILFGLMHGVEGFIGALVFGMCMCILYLKTSNILISMTVHFLNNLSYEVVNLLNLDNLNSILHIPESMVIIIAVIIIIISAYFLFTFIKREWGNLT